MNEKRKCANAIGYRCKNQEKFNVDKAIKIKLKTYYQDGNLIPNGKYHGRNRQNKAMRQ